MKRPLYIAALLLGTGIFVAPVSALTSDTPPPQDPMIIKPGDPDSHVVLNKVAEGSVVTADSVLEFIKLKDQVGRVMSFYVDSNTPIYDEMNRRIAFPDIRQGQILSVQYQPDTYTVAQINRIPVGE